MLNTSSSIVQAALKNRSPQLFDVVDADGWPATLEALREADGYAPSLSEPEAEQLEAQIRAALPPALRDGYRQLADYFTEEKASEVDAALKRATTAPTLKRRSRPNGQRR